MKYIKLFEDINEPEKGDYILLSPYNWFSSMIGKIEDCSHHLKEIQYGISFDPPDDSGFTKVFRFSREEITHWSKDITIIERALEKRMKEKQFDL